MDKLTAIKIKYDDGTYSDEIPVSVLSENVEWDNTHTLVDVLGSIDVDAKGSLQNQIDNIGNTIYPVGAIYLSTTDTSPASLFGGTWERLKDRFLLAAGDSYAAGSTGGEATHQLTLAEMPRHRHSSDSYQNGYASDSTDKEKYCMWVNNGRYDNNGPRTDQNGYVRTSQVGGE